MQYKKQMIEEILEDYGINPRMYRAIAENKSYPSMEEFEKCFIQNYPSFVSSYYFPGDFCLFYPRTLEVRAKSLKTCDLTAAPIQKGSFYLAYRPLIDDITSGKTYVIKRTIQIEVGSRSFLPQTLQEFEELVEKLGSRYEIQDNDWDYYQLSKSLGEYMPLLELKKRRKKR